MNVNAQPVRPARLLYSMGAPVAGDTLTNPTTKMPFATTYTPGIPANLLRVGDVLEVDCSVFFTFVGATTFTWELGIGATALSFLTVGASGANTYMHIKFIATIVTVGSGGTLDWEGQFIGPASTIRATGNAALAVAIDTTVASIVALSVTNTTSNGGNTDALMLMTVTHKPA